MKTLKTFKLTILFVAFLSIGFVSCQKEFTPENTVISDSTIVNKDSFYLDKIYGDFGNGMDSNKFYKLVYDDKKRVVAMIDSNFYFDSDETENYFYFYHASDSMPYKFVSNFKSDVYKYDDTIYYFYNLTGQKIKDSSVYVGNFDVDIIDTAVQVSSYSYAPQKVFVFTTDYILRYPDTSYHKDTAILDVMGNILESRIYNYVFGVDDLVGISKFTYDGHPSPFANLTSRWAHQELPSTETTFLEYIANSNIITQQQNNYSGGILDPLHFYKVNNTYSYNPRGVPILQTEKDLEAVPPREYKYYYKYRAL